MLTITEQIPDFDTYEDYLGYRGETALFFDIETTGLSASTAIIFLIGAVKKCGDGWRLTQWLAQRPEDEPELLRAFFDTAAGCDTLIHFNGTTFDLPFLRERAKRVCNMLPESSSAESTGGSEITASDSSAALPCRCNLDNRASIDLYQKFRPLKSVLGLPRMNQTTLEAFLGWPREDRLSGKQMVSLFQKYAASQEPKLRDLLLLHNHDDLLGMTDLLRLCAYSMLFDGQFASVGASIRLDNLVLTNQSASGNRDFSDSPDESDATHACLELRLMLKTALPKELSLSFPYPGSVLRCTLTASGTQAVLSIPGFRGELRHFFPNYRDYYYLPLEDQAVHKSVGAFVGKEYRSPARPENCCVKKSGLFFPQPEECFSPAFRSSYESKELFFACPEAESALFSESGHEPTSALPFPEETLTAYAASLLRMLMRLA